MNSVSQSPEVPSGPAGAPISTTTRVRGGLLVVIGLVLAIGAAVVVFNLLPTMLNPGAPVDGSTFNGSVELGRTVIAFLAWIGLFGLGIVAGGAFLLRQGRYPRAYVIAMGVVIAITVFGMIRLKSLLG